MKTRTVIIPILMLFAAEAPGKDYKGAELRTKLSYLYGRFEARFMSVAREGVLASFFTYHDGIMPTIWNEIDIEILGRYDDEIQFNVITPGQVDHVGRRLLGFNPHWSFHTYAFEWTPSYVAWFVDGVEVYRQTGSHIQSLTRAQKIMMNIWNPQYPDWVGVWDDRVLPAFAFYDWVSYASYTPGSGNTGTGSNFSIQWKDDFNTYDAQRWDRGTHTWEGNGCDFVVDNVVYSGGYMILCLTDPYHLGWTDAAAPVLLWARQSGDRVLAQFSEELDSVSAGTVANYIISPGATVTSATLLPDPRAVELVTAGMTDTTINYNLIIMGMNDRAVPSNRSGAHARFIYRSSYLPLPIQINVGGSAVGSFLSDREWSPAADYGFQDGDVIVYPSTLQIAGTPEPELFRTERRGLVFYRIRVPAGVYRVMLLMAENTASGPGERVFTVGVEGAARTQDLDIIQRVGKNTALTLTFPAVRVDDGVLDVHFGASTDAPILNAIIVDAEPTGVRRQEDPRKADFGLLQNFPNPFNGETVIRFHLPEPGSPVFRVFNLAGQEIFSAALGSLPAGESSLLWAASDRVGQSLASGVYLYSVESAARCGWSKLMILR